MPGTSLQTCCRPYRVAKAKDEEGRLWMTLFTKQVLGNHARRAEIAWLFQKKFAVSNGN
jgi:hypothetical protein